MTVLLQSGQLQRERLSFLLRENQVFPGEFCRLGMINASLAGLLQRGVALVAEES